MSNFQTRPRYENGAVWRRNLATICVPSHSLSFVPAREIPYWRMSHAEALVLVHVYENLDATAVDEGQFGAVEDDGAIDIGQRFLQARSGR